MANEELRFDIIGNDRATGAFSRVGGSVKDMGDRMNIATKQALVLDEALNRQRTAARSSVDATLALAKADDILAEAEHTLRDGALEAELALKRETEAKKKSGDAALEAAAKNKKLQDSFNKVGSNAQEKGGPAWLGPALLAAPVASSIVGVGLGAAAGIGGAAIAGAASLAAFGAVAKPVLAQALTAEQAVSKAQDAYNIAIDHGTKKAVAYKAEQIAIGKAYAEMSPQQVALSRQLGNMANAWQAFKAAETPLVAGALQPWLKGITTGLQSLGSVIKPMGPVIHDLGTQFGNLTNSSVFRTFAAWIGTTGAAVTKSAGNAVLDLLTGITFVLPQFTPLIKGAADGLSKMGDAFVKWSASQKAANEIHSFLDWFHSNGPLVTTLLKNVGGALKALAPGLGPATATELKVVSDFFGFIAKLPPSVAKPLTETAATLLILNKLGVVKVGLNVSGKLAGKFATSALGKSLLGDAGAAGLILPVTLSVAAIAGLSQIKDKTGGGSLLAPKAADLGFNGRWAQDIAHWWDVLNSDIGNIQAKMRHATFAWADSVKAGVITDLDSMRHQASGIWDSMWSNTVGRANRGSADTLKVLGGWEHNVAHWFDVARNDTAHIWDVMWQNTIGRLNRGSADTIKYLSGWEHNVAHWFDVARNDAASIWNSTWNNTVSRVARGVNDVVSWLKTLDSRARSALGSLGSQLWSIGSQALSDLLKGMKAGASSIGGWLQNFAKGVVGVFKKIWGWFSPSRVMYEGGKALMDGLANGIKDHAHKAQSAASVVANKVANVGSGVQRWKGIVDQALRLNGVSTAFDANVLYQMQTESGGDPNIVNNWDSNAKAGTPSKGLMQVIGPTFAAYHVAGTSNNILDPLANVAAAINYAKHVYGPSLANRYGGIGSGHGYASGTLSAAPGWAWVGERGPELMHFRGGEQVVPAHAAKAGSTYVINVHPTPLARPADIGREVVGAIKAHEQRSGKGWRS